MLLIVPYLLATSFFGLTGALFFTDSESPVLMIPFFSVGLIFLSGVSYPLELIPWYWQAAHYALPAAPGVLAYVKINSMGASLHDIRREYIVLWAQCAVYFLTACAVLRHNIRKARRSMPRTADPAPPHGPAAPKSADPPRTDRTAEKKGGGPHESKTFRNPHENPVLAAAIRSAGTGYLQKIISEVCNIEKFQYLYLINRSPFAKRTVSKTHNRDHMFNLKTRKTY